jgi:hypothetical protein
LSRVREQDFADSERRRRFAALGEPVEVLVVN